MDNAEEVVPHDIQVSNDGSTVWVTSSDGSCVGRFSKTFGLDVHRTVTEQLAGAGQCLFCTHGKANMEDWDTFREKIKTHHGIDVPAALLEWDSPTPCL